MANDIRPKTISFKDGRDLDYIDSLFRPGTRLYKRVPDAWKGNRSKRVRWAIETLAKLYDGGIDNLQSELFEPESEEMKVTTDEVKRLKEVTTSQEQRIKQLESIEDGYIDTVNSINQELAEQVTTLKFYRGIVRDAHLEVQEDKELWHHMGEELWYPVQP